MAVQIFGPFALGALPTFTFTFQQSGVNTDPSSAVCNLTPPNGTKASQTLSHTGTGVYTLTVSCTTAGQWTGTVYAPPGIGQASQPFAFEVQTDPNYP